MTGQAWLWWIPALPLAGAAVNGAVALWKRWTPGERHTDTTGRWPAGWIASAAMLGAFFVALYGFARLTGLPLEDRALASTAVSWIRAGTVDVRAALVLDALSAVMALVVTGVGFLIHVYSVGYMAHDPDRDRYFAYLNLFAGLMLVLVLGDGLPLLFVGWEGVGLCSYLLIGFWYRDEAKAKAGKKAFVVNRVGDFGFLLGMIVLFLVSPPGRPTLAFETLRELGPVAPGMLTAAALLLFVGACGKSAQFPLYLWLPDAMAGPTPVSALIHAATMVTSGVYMIARLSFLFEASETACAVIASVGAFTALIAATIGFVQNDIKKVLAYSTVSQLGFMVLAVGVGGYAAGVFHLTTHAFFKALLFLAAGSVIHAMEHALPHGDDPNDIRRMGGLRTRLPATFWVFLAGWAAIVGIPGTSGFFSKEEILVSVLRAERIPAWLVGPLFAAAVLAAGCTAFYMTRLLWLVFLGRPRMEPAVASKVKDGGPTMQLPLVPLALLSIVAGFGWTSFEGWLAPLLHGVVEAAHRGVEAAAHAHPGVGGHGNPAPWALAALAIGAGTAYVVYDRRPELAASWSAQFRGWHRLLQRKYWLDEIAEGLFVRPIHALSKGFLWRAVDVRVVDGTVNGVGRAARSGAAFVSRLQTGRIQRYALGVASGLAAVSIYVVARLRGGG